MKMITKLIISQEELVEAVNSFFSTEFPESECTVTIKDDEYTFFYDEERSYI